jgi:hypothetical protein
MVPHSLQGMYNSCPLWPHGEEDIVLHLRYTIPGSPQRRGVRNHLAGYVQSTRRHDCVVRERSAASMLLYLRYLEVGKGVVYGTMKSSHSETR